MSDSSLAGKCAVVTGASKGIGYAVADSLAAAGCHVVICARQAAEVQRAVEKLAARVPQVKISGLATDVSRPAEVAALFRFADETFKKRLDILINNAGLGVFRPAAELTVEEWDQMIGVNLSGAFYCSREALPRLAQSGGGSIINISSLAGKNPFAGGSGYNASKFGMNGFSEAMMLDHRQQNIRVSYVMPGSVDTEFGGHAADSKAWKIAPEDIADIVMHILRLPARTLVSRVEVRPSRPQKG